MLRFCLIAFSLALAPSFARAQDSTPNLPPIELPAEASPDASAARFTFNKVDNGFLRLDSQTGQVALCSARAAGWACEMVPEDRAALDKEIGRLQDENAALKKKLAAGTPAAGQDKNNDKNAAELKLKMPSDEDLRRARNFIEDAWRRLVEMIASVQKDMRKG